MPFHAFEGRWTYEKLAELCNMSVKAVHQARSRKEFDPLDFASLFPWIARKGKPEIRRAILDYGFMQDTAINPLVKKGKPAQKRAEINEVQAERLAKLRAKARKAD